jgi:hypothetical protein
MQITQLDAFGSQDRPMASEAKGARIGMNVIQSLGSPADMLKVKVNPVGGDRYRVNVMVGKNDGSARVADSFFLTADAEGNIVTSSPTITRLY